jgi:glyoxylase-like metal-dependent hydrolase (beta-lactamase superfamily II)
MRRTAPVDGATHAIDLFFRDRPEVIAAYLLEGRGADRPALVETGPASCLPALEAGLAERGLRLEDLGAVVVTHIHLDHAGAAGVIAERVPAIPVYVHPAGAPHLIDPSRLLRSAQRIYGAQMDALWGAVRPIARERVVALEDGAEIRVAGRLLRALSTPGHASHHHAFLEPETGTAFTGDVAGIALPGGSYVRPPTPPPDLDLEAWTASLDRLAAQRPRRLCLTHFGPRADAENVIGQSRARIWEYAEVLRPAWVRGATVDELLETLRAHVRPEMLAALGVELADRYDLAGAMRMNVEGFVRYFEKREAAKAPPA